MPPSESSNSKDEERGEGVREVARGASDNLKAKSPRCSKESEERGIPKLANSSKTKTPRSTKGERGGEELKTGTVAANSPKTRSKIPHSRKSSEEEGGTSVAAGTAKKAKAKTPRGSKGKEKEEGESSAVAAAATSTLGAKLPRHRDRKETPDSPKNQRRESTGAPTGTSLSEPSSAPTVVSTTLTMASNDAASSADSNWQPVVVGRIRKTRKKPVLHDLPPLQIGPADTPNSNQALVFSNGNPTQEEFNAHIQERIQRVSRGAPTSTGVARSIPKNELVARFENERTDHFKEAWRKYPEVPTTEELLREVVHLPTNIVNGSFDSVDEYLETHYELLREDAFSGLRDAVAHLRRCPESNDTNDVVIYEDVRVLGLTFSNMGVACKISFSINRAGKKIRWDQSKRLIPGTLVCLSSDGFETVKVATVAARPKEGLELNPPEIDLLFNENEMELDTQKEMIMVESKNGYFEAYKWTLRALQRMTDDNFPLHEHLCFLDNNIPPPVYVKRKLIFNLSSIFPDNPDKETLEDVDIINDWPQGVQTSMDESQMKGLHQILTKRLGILQGPPGTGKTFVSTNALQILLQNMREGDPPIIVACQTNHALDQLLNHVLKFESEFIRLGGRTADKEKIKERTIYEIRQKVNINIQGSGLGAANANMKKLRDKMITLLDPLKQELLTEDDFLKWGLITSAQARSFTSRAANWIVVEDDQPAGGYMGQWLGDYFVPIQTHEPVEVEYEEADIEYERIKEMEAEFHGVSDEVDGRLRGIFFAMGREYTVIEPDGVDMREINIGLQTSNVWELEEHTRAAIYLHLRKKVISLIWKQVRELNIKYQKYSQEHRIARLEKDAYILSTTKLIGMTTTGLSKYRSIIAAVKPKIVLIEEAAEALEGPVTVACMPSVEHLILVGDHEQLRGHCAVQDLEGQPYFLDISMFERLVTNDFPFVTLRMQRRMRPEIRELLGPIYKDKLVDHATVLGRESIQGMGDTNVFWYSHSYEESTDEVHSRRNTLESQMVVNFADYLVLNGMDSKKITILTFYGGQRTLIRQTILNHPNLGRTLMKVQTVDSYQGEENEVILLSLVRSNNYNSIGFLSIQNRVCVALSRAKRGFYIFGNAKLATAADKLWWEIGRILNEPPSRIGVRLPLTCQKHKARTEIEDVIDWMDINGGCRKLCKEILPCRHACTLRCHAFEHKEIRCISPCTRILLCGHQCVNRLCCEECICPKCGRGQKALEEVPVNTTAQVAIRSAAGVGSGGRTNLRAIQDSPSTPPLPQAGSTALVGQRKFEGQLSAFQITNERQAPPIPKLVEIDEWEAALPGNQQQQPVLTNQEDFPDMAVAIRAPPSPPNNKQNGRPTAQITSNSYHDKNSYNPNGGSNVPTRGGGVYGVPRLQIKDRWPDEDENGQVIDDRVDREERMYGQDSGRGGYSQGNRGNYDQQSGRGEYIQRDERGGYSQLENRGNYSQRDDRGGYSQQGYDKDYGQRDDRGGYGPQGHREDYDQRDDRGGFFQQANRGDYSQRDGRGGYNQQRGGVDYGQRNGQRDDRGGYSQQGDGRGYNEQEDRVEYNQRGDRGGYGQQGNRGEYSQQGGRGEYSQQGSREGYGQHGGREGYGQQGGRGDYEQQGNRGEYSPQAKATYSQQASGAYPAQDPWPTLGVARGGPGSPSRGQVPRQAGAWNGAGIPNRGQPGGGPAGRGAPVRGGQENAWGGRGRNSNRVTNSYTHYR